MSEFGQLLELQTLRLRRYAQAPTRDTPAADDLVQRYLVRAIVKQRPWQPGTNLRKWLFTMPHHQRAAAPSHAELAEHHAEPVAVRALLLGERLDIRSLEGSNALAIASVALSIPGGAVAVLFRYGVVVLFGAGRDTAERFLASVDPFVSEPLPIPEQDEAQLVIRTGTDQRLDSSGNIVLRERTIERLQLRADVLAKNLVLAHYETRIAAIFDRIEPLAATLRKKGRAGARQGVAAAHRQCAGDATQNGRSRRNWREARAALGAPGTRTSLYAPHMRLADEYELRERDRALDRKLDVVSRTVETVLGLVQTRSSTRVEWYIVLLIVAEPVPAAYSLLLNR